MSNQHQRALLQNLADGLHNRKSVPVYRTRILAGGYKEYLEEACDAAAKVALEVGAVMDISA
jgi:hypothetical protein